MAVKPLQMDDSNNVLEVVGRCVLNGDLTVGGFGAGSGIISPATLSGVNQDDWTPAGIQAASVVRITPGGAINITGIIAPSPVRGKLLMLTNLDGTNTITLIHDSTSTAANRIYGPNASNAALRKKSSCWLWYDVTAARWLVLTL